MEQNLHCWTFFPISSIFKGQVSAVCPINDHQIKPVIHNACPHVGLVGGRFWYTEKHLVFLCTPTFQGNTIKPKHVQICDNSNNSSMGWKLSLLY